MPSAVLRQDPDGVDLVSSRQFSRVAVTKPAAGRRPSRAALFDLYGGFGVEGGRPGALRLSALLRLGEDVGIRPAAIRAAAVRMVQRGWLEVERASRESVYRLTVAGRQLIDQGRERIFTPRPVEWDGEWCLVAVSVPEARRDVRDRMRKELAWLGFGSPSPGLFISPHDHGASVTRVATRLGAAGWVTIYRATNEAPEDPHLLVRRGWPELGAVDLRYQRFVADFARRRAGARSDRRSPIDAFRTCFALLSEYRRCLYADPELPRELLPARWHGAAARALFIETHAALIDDALAHFDAVREGNTASRPDRS